jgi:hypothetical protein
MHKSVKEGVELDVKECFFLHDLLSLKQDINLLLESVRFCHQLSLLLDAIVLIS